MKIALCTTTIHVPHALKLMRKCSSTVGIFVAIDEKTPTEAIDFCVDLDVTKIVHSGCGPMWKCSDAIGWNTLARRNIAFLEALKWGADVIYSWDNDNLPCPDIDGVWFSHIENLCSGDPFYGIQMTGPWFDPGCLLIPPTRHRGIPHAGRASKCAAPIVDARIGIAAGLVIGDPDVDASTRMEIRPDIGSVHILGTTGAVVKCGSWTVFNSQNTAVIRELIPAWFMMPGVGRHDDIYASLIVQRVARERGLHVHFGQPFTYQQRNEHNLVTDLRAEIDGMEGVEKLADLLDVLVLPGRNVIEDTRIIYDSLCFCGFIPQKSASAGLVWLEDCAGVM